MTEGTLLAAADVTAMLFWTLRVAAGVGAALVGWFGMAPVVRLLYRGAFQRPVPRWLLPWARLAGAALFGFLVFWYLPLGGGGGLGWGPGEGAGPGLGPGDGSGKTAGETKVGADKPGTDKPGVGKGLKKDLETLEIEVIGGVRYKGDNRYYLVKRQEPALTMEEVDDYLQKNADRLDTDVYIVLTPTKSVDEGHGAVRRLKFIIEKTKRADNSHLAPQVKNVDGS